MAEQVTLVAPDGSAAVQNTVILTTEEAELLRTYKKFLAARGLREALYCNTCWEGQLADGCEAHVTNSQILIKCRCTSRFYQGQTF